MKAATSIASPSQKTDTIHGSLSGLGNPFKLAFEQSQHVQCLISIDGKILAANGKARALVTKSGAKFNLLGKRIWSASWWRSEQGIIITQLFKQALKNERAQAKLDLNSSQQAPKSYQFQFTPINDVLGNISVILLEGHPLSKEQLELSTTGDNADGLTGLAKQHILKDYLNAIIQTNKHNPSYFFAVLSFKLSHLKSLRQKLSNSAQENLIINIARQFRANTRDSDLVARVSEDTFVVILDRLQVTHNALDFAERCLKFLIDEGQLVKQTLSLEANIGIAFGDSHSSAEILLAQANEALEQAEHSASNIIVYGMSQFEDGSI